MLHYICVFAGGGAGCMARYALGVRMASYTQSGQIPWHTLTINLLGCLFIGLLLGYLQTRPNSYLAALLVSGFCGGFTTFSTFSNETLELLRNGHTLTTLSYLIISLGVGLCCTAVGYILARQLA